MRMFLLALMALLFAAGEPALAQPASWRISEASGDVRIIEGGRARPATRGALLSGGSEVATAQRARAVLVRGRDYVIVSPASRIRVPTAAQGGRSGLVQMIAEAGTAMFRIEHRATPHFAVQTPYLAAVVKGTVFTVTVSEAGASVQVTEGAVEVSTADGGAAELVRPGTIATVAAADLRQLNIQGETSRSIRSNGAPAAGAVIVPPSEAGNYQGPADSRTVVVASVTEEPIALAEVTGGLVEGNAGIDLALADARDAARPDAGGNGNAGNAGNDTSGPGIANGDGGGSETATPGNDGDAGNSGSAGDGDNSGSGTANGGGDDAANAGDDDGNDGHGNDGDGNDSSNPGNGGGNDNSGPGNNNGGGDDATDDDGNNGHGNDDDGDDSSNPGNGGGNDNSGPGNNNGGGDDATDDDGNNGHGNDDDGDDSSNPGNGGGNDNSGPGNNNGGGNDDDDNSGPGNGHGGGHGDDDGDDPD
jgi:hypothetical protein